MDDLSTEEAISQEQAACHQLGSSSEGGGQTAAHLRRLRQAQQARTQRLAQKLQQVPPDQAPAILKEDPQRFFSQLK